MNSPFCKVALAIILLVFVQACRPKGTEKQSVPSQLVPKAANPAPEIDLEKEKIQVNASLDKILRLFSLSNNKTVAALIVYAGPDPERNWKSVCQYAHKEEKLRVDILSAQVRMLSEEAQDVKKGKFRIETESEGTWYLQEMIYTFPDEKTESKYFGFLKINGNYCLGDIN